MHVCIGKRVATENNMIYLSQRVLRFVPNAAQENSRHIFIKSWRHNHRGHHRFAKPTLGDGTVRIQQTQYSLCLVTVQIVTDGTIEPIQRTMNLEETNAIRWTFLAKFISGKLNTVIQFFFQSFVNAKIIVGANK